MDGHPLGQGSFRQKQALFLRREKTVPVEFLSPLRTLRHDRKDGRFRRLTGGFKISGPESVKKIRWVFFL